MTLDQVIQRFGGDAAVATLCGCGQPAVSNWRARGGLPPARAIQLLRLAKHKGIRLRLEDLPVDTRLNGTCREGRP